MCQKVTKEYLWQPREEDGSAGSVSCFLGRTAGRELGCDLIRTKLLAENESIYQPQSSKISEKQQEKIGGKQKKQGPRKFV